MAFRFNGIECDTYGELQQILASKTVSKGVGNSRRGPGGLCNGQDSGCRPIGDDTDHCTLMYGHTGPCKF